MMRRTMAIALTMVAALSTTTLAQEGHPDEAKDHGEKKGEHMEMRMHAPAFGMLAGHAEELGLSEDQVDRLDALKERSEAEKERHHAEMRSIHEAAKEVLTPEQRERAHELMRSMHGEHGEMKAHGMKAHGESDDEAGHEDHDG